MPHSLVDFCVAQWSSG